MTRRELAAARITDPALRAAYARCRQLNARHGRTYFLATRLLPVERRTAVHALYGFARWADDIVDDLDRRLTPAERDRLLLELEGDLARGLRTGGGEEPVVRAVADTAERYAIDPALFCDFLVSMRSDLSVTDYPTYAELRTYMHGSAAVIGLQMLPVLGTVVPREEAAPHAAALGVAFQLTNFLRDVGEDLDRGRVYLPADLLAAHGVDRPLLEWSRRTGRRDRRIRAALVAAEALTRGVYREAEPGIAMLDPRVRPCIRAATTLYGGILDAIADQEYDVLHRRAVVSRTRRAATAAAGVARVLGARWRARAQEFTPHGRAEAPEPHSPHSPNSPVERTSQ
ncbi:phytoene/squalene synthase family protein [Streptomyces sp. NPDC005879]|uniref:phytoene/squalene synthase family protein n=3 Tax=unclassified Streptomyces TaxID=2593676 RepID=UPI0033F63F33